MKFEVIDHKKNPLLKREEVILTVDHGGKATPSRAEMLAPLAKELKSEKDLILVEKIFSIKGLGSSRIKAFVYKKREDVPKERLEALKKRMEKKAKSEEKPAEAAAPAPAGEAKAGETKEQAKEEQKPEEKPKEEANKEEQPKQEEKPKEAPEGKGE